MKCTGFLLSIGILAIMASCAKESILYDENEILTEEVKTKEANTDEGRDFESESGQATDVYIADGQEEVMMVVHLCGAVNNPGVYELELNSRIIDGVVRAGGFREDACEEALNLASPLTDGSRVYVPTLEEVSENLNDSGQTADPNKYVQTAGTGGSESGDKDNGLVNINTAGADRLITLPGIGESRAKSIIAYREEHGAFKKIEDIMQVSGIKEGAFAKIKDSITVN